MMCSKFRFQYIGKKKEPRKEGRLLLLEGDSPSHPVSHLDAGVGCMTAAAELWYREGSIQFELNSNSIQFNSNSIHRLSPDSVHQTLFLNLSFPALLGHIPAQRHLWAVCKDFRLQQSVQNGTRQF
jgi:hypothetical protein